MTLIDCGEIVDNIMALEDHQNGVLMSFEMFSWLAVGKIRFGS